MTSSAEDGACGEDGSLTFWDKEPWLHVVGGALFLGTKIGEHGGENDLLSELSGSGVISTSLLLFILSMNSSQLRCSCSLQQPAFDDYLLL